MTILWVVLAVAAACVVVEWIGSGFVVDGWVVLGVLLGLGLLLLLFIGAPVTA